MSLETGSNFIEDKYPDTADKARPRKRVGERFQRIAANPRASARLEKLILDTYTLDTTDEATLQRLANALYESEKRIAIEQGRGADIAKLDEEEVLARYRKAVIEKEEIQRRTLGSWLDYLKEAPEEEYPMWFKYYVIRSLKDMGRFSRDETTYANRTADTIAPFPELNQEALGFVKKALQHEFAKEGFDPEAETETADFALTEEEIATITTKAPPDKLEEALKSAKRNKRKAYVKRAKAEFASDQDEAFLAELPLNEERVPELSAELKRRLATKDFAKLYAFAQVECAGNLDRESLEGEWVKYDQGSDYHLLEDALKGKGTGWCTAEGSAENQIANGDFYVFYTKNKDGIPTEPRIAIRMQDNAIAEIRGVDPRQELEPELVETAREKYKDLPGAEKYEKASADMKQMTSIYNKCFRIDKDTDEKIYLSPTLTKEELRFLYEIDGKIQSFGYDKDPRIQEVLDTRDDIKADLTTVLDCRPEQISTTEEEALSGDIVFHYGNLDLDNLQNAEGLTLPQTVGGDIYLGSLQRAEGLTLPQKVGGFLDLASLRNAEGLTLPQTVGDGLNLGSLQRAEGLTLPETVGGSLTLRSLQSAEGLTLPETVGDFLDLASLQNAEGLTLPETVGGDLVLENLQRTEGLTQPQKVGGYLDLKSLQSAEGLTLPQKVSGGLNLRNLQRAEGLTLPQTVGGDLDLENLRNAEGLTLPQTVDGNIYLGSLSGTEEQLLKEIYPEHAHKFSSF